MLFIPELFIIMNPFSLKRTGFRKGNNARTHSVFNGKSRINSRSSRSFVHKSVRLKESYGAVGKMNKLSCSLLNVNGLTEDSLADVKDVLMRKQPDLCVLLETKLRLEEDGLCLDVPGYDVVERRRSDMAGDRGGGGLAVYTRKRDGLVFRQHEPIIDDPAHVFVRSERAWTTIQSSKGKTAVCSVYAGFQAPDDRHGAWNDTLYSVLKSEIYKMRTDGYRVVLLGDFNGHIGMDVNVGIPGNHPGVNRNGRRFLDFLDESHCVHINGCPQLCKGLWTRQSMGVSTILDYGVVGREHLSSVLSMVIDDRGVYGGGSDHNWVFLELQDSFVRKMRISNLPRQKMSWNIKENFDWSAFEGSVNDMVDGTDENDITDAALATKAADILIQSGLKTVGLRSRSTKSSILSTSLPGVLVNEIKLKRQMERVWKTKCSVLSSLPANLRTAELQREL